MTKKKFSNLTNPADTLIESMDSVNAAELHKQQALHQLMQQRAALSMQVYCSSRPRLTA
ncbi:hypothetical protein ACXYMV_00535 [Limosilactobacillus fermentum]